MLNPPFSPRVKAKVPGWPAQTSCPCPHSPRSVTLLQPPRCPCSSWNTPKCSYAFLIISLGLISKLQLLGRGMYIFKSSWQFFLQEGSINFHAYQKCVSVPFPLHTHQLRVLSFLDSLCQVAPCHCILHVSFIERALYSWIRNNHFIATERWSSCGRFL